MTDKIKVMREKYKPETVKCLFIAESPPICTDLEEIRFFYNPNSLKWDFLFNSLMEVIYPDKKSSSDKPTLLYRFKSDGYYLIDAVDFPINNVPVKDRKRIILRERPYKLGELRVLINTHVPIFLIKKLVHDLYYEVLIEEGYSVMNDLFLPFPSTGNQKKFKDQLRRFIPIL